eukprot:CAMPEP_0197185046 /NCGR_PEP_ID=MMETSP1423-20130617/11110_1 /TAXON_ID=476441 /ORGANISM="Pseudo-nitzschia heimii, Strain UNC1101" /LENGTH=136 /DNA_ID=CAMNT_0042636009 /DNA_START=66 /DNA_END=476 /DNA_ORIENTATION=+
MDNYEQYDGEAEGPAPIDGAFVRVNGGMLQSGKFTNQIVSLVGNITAHDTIRTADGSEIRIATEALAETDSGGLIVDPNKAVEIMGQPSGPNEITAFIWRDLGEMDLSLYNKLIAMQQQDKYLQYFSPGPKQAGGQ